MNEEDKFINTHPNYGEMFYDDSIGEMSEYGINDRLNYLRDRIFSKIHKTLNEPLGKEIEFGLSEAQRVLLRLFYCKHSHIFRDDYYYNGISEFVQNLFDTLDDAVNKAPTNSDPILYRFCNEYDKCDMKIGDIILFPYNLTCTNYDWHQEKDRNVYIITPLRQKTNAHNLFEIYEHGDEKQVDFLRNTKFLVTNIEDTCGTSYKKFYMEEI